MSAIKVNRSDNVKLTCKAADNAIHGFLNGDEVYYKQGVNERNFTDERRLTEILRDGYNSLLIVGTRWGTNYLYDVTIEVNGNVVASHVERQPPPGNSPTGIAWDFSIEFDMASA